tara:strand:+ start:7062 stop:8228 length:1167 start_codon:yes stop_codon:yes gene_type:complete
MKIQNKIPYGQQFLDQRDEKEVLNSLKQKFITTGAYVQKFEKSFKRKFKSKYAFTCSNATAGLHLAFMSINLSKSDVVLMPAINFISSYRTAKMMGAKIYLVDVDEMTGQMSVENILKCIKINNLKKIKAIITMYLGGYVENNIDFYYLKKRLGCYLIEDACHAIGSKYKFKNSYFYVGSCKHSDVCVFSFHPVKTITTGEGGIVSTNNKKIAKRLSILRNHGIIRGKNYWDYDIKDLGFNYRLSDINCALGLSQLNKIELFFRKRKKIFDLYKKNFKPYYEFLHFPKSKNKYNLYHLFLLGINFNKIKKDKNAFIIYLNKKGIFPQFHYKPIFKFSFFKNKNFKKFPGTIKYYKNYLSLPIYYNLSKKEQMFIISKIISYLKKNKKK